MVTVQNIGSKRHYVLNSFQLKSFFADINKQFVDQYTKHEKDFEQNSNFAQLTPISDVRVSEFKEKDDPKEKYFTERKIQKLKSLIDRGA